MTPERVLKALIERGDIAQVGGGHVLVSDLSEELLEFITTYEAHLEDIEDDDAEEDASVEEENAQRIKCNVG